MEEGRTEGRKAVRMEGREDERTDATNEGRKEESGESAGIYRLSAVNS